MNGPESTPQTPSDFSPRPEGDVLPDPTVTPVVADTAPKSGISPLNLAAGAVMAGSAFLSSRGYETGIHHMDNGEAIRSLPAAGMAFLGRKAVGGEGKRKNEKPKGSIEKLQDALRVHREASLAYTHDTQEVSDDKIDIMDGTDVPAAQPREPKTPTNPNRPRTLVQQAQSMRNSHRTHKGLEHINRQKELEGLHGKIIRDPNAVEEAIKNGNYRASEKRRLRKAAREVAEIQHHFGPAQGPTGDRLEGERLKNYEPLKRAAENRDLPGRVLRARIRFAGGTVPPLRTTEASHHEETPQETPEERAYSKQVIRIAAQKVDREAANLRREHRLQVLPENVYEDLLDKVRTEVWEKAAEKDMTVDDLSEITDYDAFMSATNDDYNAPEATPSREDLSAFFAKSREAGDRIESIKPGGHGKGRQEHGQRRGERSERSQRRHPDQIEISEEDAALLLMVDDEVKQTLDEKLESKLESQGKTRLSKEEYKDLAEKTRDEIYRKYFGADIDKEFIIRTWTVIKALRDAQREAEREASNPIATAFADAGLTKTQKADEQKAAQTDATTPAKPGTDLVYVARHVETDAADDTNVIDAEIVEED